MADGDIKTSWAFGSYRVTRSRRSVERNGEIVRLGGRAFDVLVYLLEHAGQVVSHRALLEAVWPGTYVEEGNLRFQMAVLRKALGNGEASYIINVPGRGYCFTALLSKQEEVECSPCLPSNVVAQPVTLTSPLTNEDLLACNILPHPATQSFMKRAREALGAVSSDKEEKCAAQICTKLDDLALAIELIASQVEV